MLQMISKSQFKPQVLEYLRIVEKTKQPIIISHAGKPVIQIVPYNEKEEVLSQLRTSVISFDDPTKPVGVDEWEAMK